MSEVPCIQPQRVSDQLSKLQTGHLMTCKVAVHMQVGGMAMCIVETAIIGLFMAASTGLVFCVAYS